MRLKHFMLGAVSGLALLMAVPAMAAETEPIEFPMTGFACTLPEQYSDMEGSLMNDDQGALYSYNVEDLCGSMYYRPRTQEQMDELVRYLESVDQENPPEEAIQKYNEFVADDTSLFDVFGLKDGKAPEDLVSLLFEGQDPYDHKVFLGEKDGIQYYLMTYDFEKTGLAEQISRMPEEMRREMQAVKDEVVAHPEDFAITGSEYTASTPATGSRISFEVTDLDGKPVTSEELFAKNKITLVSIWQTWCGPCVAEMPELEELLKEYGPKGFGVAAYCSDADSKEMKQQAKEIAGAYNFVNLAYSDSVEKALPWFCTPFAYLVDEKGTILRCPIVGSDMETIRKALDSFFAGETAPAAEEEAAKLAVAPEEGAAQQAAEGTYTVKVTDQNGDAVPGVMATFCTDTTCSMAEGDADGVLTFRGAPQAYHISLLGVPEGYSFDADAQFYTEAEPGMTTITITKN